MSKRYSLSDVVNASRFRCRDPRQLLSCQLCGCYSCLAVFFPKDIADWVITDEGLEAVCPFCEELTVIGDSSGYVIDADLLLAMKRYNADHM